MSKKLSVRFVLMLLLVLCMAAAVPRVLAYAAESLPRLVDDADLLSAGEEKELLSGLDGISRKQQVDVVVVTVRSLEGKSAMDYADDFYDKNGYGNDGILLLVSMEERDWWISTAGFGITAFTDAGLDYISEKFLPALSDGDYAGAFSTYAELCGAFIEQAKAGRPYDAGHLPKAPFHAGRSLLVALSCGFLAALVITSVMRGQLKTVRPRTEARDYVKKGSLQVARSRDLFLYRHIDRRKKPESSSAGGSGTHRYSSGVSHGGRGGKF